MTELCLLVRWLQRKTIECESMSIPGGGSPIVCISSAGTGRGRTPRGQHLSHVSNRVCCTVLRRWRMRREDLNQESRHSSRQRVAKEEAPADINPWILGRSSTIAKVVPAINKFNMCSVSRGGGVHTFRASSSWTWTNVGFRRHRPSDEAAIQLIKAVCKPWVVNDMAIYLFRHCCERRIITSRDWD